MWILLGLSQIRGGRRQEVGGNELKGLNDNHNIRLGCEKRLNFETFEGYELDFIKSRDYSWLCLN